MVRENSRFQALSLAIALSALIHSFHLTHTCNTIDRDALLTLKESLIDPSSRLAHWTASEDCCTWIGVVCDDAAHVVELQLGNLFLDTDHALGGQISPSLLKLHHLHHLDFSCNNFNGIRIPEFLGSLHNLTYLNLSNAYFGGPVPRTIGNLSHLRHLDLSSYTIDQPKNDLEWLLGLHTLEYLNLGMVDLSLAGDRWLQLVNHVHSLHELRLPACRLSVVSLSLSHINFSSLAIIDLSNNGFTSVPRWLFNLSKLSYLDLSDNSLHGEIPLPFTNMTYLQTLDLSGNFMLGGALSNNLGNLCSLQKLDLSVNNFSGPITELIKGFSSCQDSKLEVLNVGYNIGLTGAIPDAIGQLKKLKYLSLRGNSFTGSVPDSIGNLSLLEELYLLNTKMSGIPPESMGNLSSLIALDFSEIPWEGVMTEAHFHGLKNLKELTIFKYALTQELPLLINISKTWIPPFKLRFLKLRSCRLGPDFPAWLRNQSELTTLYLRNTGIKDDVPGWLSKLNLELDELDLGYNEIRGTIPSSIRFNSMSTVYLNWNLFEGPLPLFSSNVSALYLSNNSFSGPIPDNIGDRLPFLTDIDFSQNSLSGSIPLSISKLDGLTTLVLSNNRLSGTIPEFWESLPLLYLVELSNNSLTGRVPSSFGALTSLKFLMISNNLLQGKIPDSLQKCTQMITLDLGVNRLFGTIPAWIGKKMSSLLILRLRSNDFDGVIPLELCELASIHILDLADNHISEIIPPCFKNLNGMKFVLNTERYEGHLQVFAKGENLLYKNSLYLVNNIDLSSNDLSGNIPPGLTELQRLGTLNLSKNRLTGNIPNKIGQLQILETLDLSRNKLSGRFPASMIDLTALNHPNFSYNNLWGRIPTSNQFGTFLDPSIYAGNPGLCGFPLPQNCSKPEDTSPGGNYESQRDDHHKFDNIGLFVSVGLGFIVGFWGVCGTLIIKISWRIAYYRFFYRVRDRMTAVVVCNCSSLWRKITFKFGSLTCN